MLGHPGVEVFKRAGGGWREVVVCLHQLVKLGLAQSRFFNPMQWQNKKPLVLIVESNQDTASGVKTPTPIMNKFLVPRGKLFNVNYVLERNIDRINPVRWNEDLLM